VEDGLLTIGAVSRLTGVPVKTIRYYADIGLLPPARVSESRYRLYGTDEVWRLELIRTFRHLGFGIEDIRGVLSGKVSAAEAIAWQREALEARVRHLERAAAILAQAEADVTATDDHSLEHIHDIGEALAVEAEERSLFLAGKLREAIVGDDAPNDWRDAFLRTVNFRMPEELSPEQAAAWVELVLLVKDPEFAAANRRHTAGLWEKLEARGIEAGWWHERMTGIGERARAAITRGASPESDEVQEIVADYLALYARAMDEEATPGFARKLAEMASGGTEGVDAKTRRFWDLLAVLDAEDLISSQDKVNDLIIAGLRHRAAREPPDERASSETPLADRPFC
jgi:DNA-binding transcriptional MerR regulator